MKFSLDLADTMFWPKVVKKEPTACWPYYRIDAAGYGRLLRAGPYVYAHRIAWMLTKGPIPKGMEVAHTCDVRNCCNPAHLFLATHTENMQDCAAKERTTLGERNYGSKLTEAQARSILSKKPAKLRYSGIAFSLAIEHGVKVGAIYSIWRGDAWRHLSPSGDKR